MEMTSALKLAPTQFDPSIGDGDVTNVANPVPRIAPRTPDDVMRLTRLGAFFPTRLSFMRTLVRRLARAQTTVRLADWSIGPEGYGHAVYTVDFGPRTYSLVAFSTPLDDANRTDRVIAEAWDTAYVLFDGIPTPMDIARLAENAPRQEAGRFLPSELILSRANRSVRLFHHVVEALASGRQPDADAIAATGYLMRTTAVYGNGKFGIADRADIAAREELAGPFQAEMLLVWLIRGFTHDLVEHIARVQAPETVVPLAPALKRHLGIGNSTGLGMAPFLVNHPQLLNNWIEARETALARVRGLTLDDPATLAALERLPGLAERAARHLDEWQVDDTVQAARIETLRSEWPHVVRAIAEVRAAPPTRPFDALYDAGGALSLEAQELLVALLLEPHGAIIDDLSADMAAPTQTSDPLRPWMRVGEMRARVARDGAWALHLDLEAPGAAQYFWYVSEDKAEPRLGVRGCEPGQEIALNLDIAQQIHGLDAALKQAPSAQTMAEFLLRHPHLRAVARRILALRDAPYGEIRDNLIGDGLRPIDMLRCKLSFFGATKFDPRSDRWTRIAMFQGAPTRDDLADPEAADDWWLRCLGPSVRPQA